MSGAPARELLAELLEIVGADQVLIDASMTSSYGTDWSRRWSSSPLAVVRPGNTAEVAAVVSSCVRHRIPVVTQGGNSGLVGGSVPHADASAIVLSTRRLGRLEPVDHATRQVIAGAGVTIDQVHQHAMSSGLRYAVDLAARGSATVGGTVATNAGGLRVLAFGDTRRQVVGIEAVLADGSVISRLGGLAKDNSGYDLSGLMVGSEGTLGVITAARLRLLGPSGAPPQVALIGLDRVADALDWLSVSGLCAAEVMLERGLALVERTLDLAHPLAARHEAYLLIEVEGTLPEMLATRDAVVGVGLWRYREAHTEVIASRGVAHKLDLAVPVAAVPDLIRGLDDVLNGALTGDVGPEEAYVFGHVGDGNLHLNLVHPQGGIDERRAGEVEARVYRLVAELGGTVAAEHGVGVAKIPWLHLTRSPAELAAARAIKAALDPQGLLNPGVLVPRSRA